MKNTTYANLLTDAQKEAFRKGDAYYKSPFKKMPARSAVHYMSSTSVYCTTNNNRVHEARMDRMISRQWN